MLNIKPLESEIKEPDEIKSNINKDRHGNLIYNDKVFDSIKKVIKEDQNSTRNNIRFSQYGSRLTFYQGNPSNFWGFIEVINGDKLENGVEPQYKIQIYSSILRKIFKKNDLTKKIFEEVI